LKLSEPFEMKCEQFKPAPKPLAGLGFVPLEFRSIFCDEFKDVFSQTFCRTPFALRHHSTGGAFGF
jgi:hypothetical protein